MKKTFFLLCALLLVLGTLLPIAGYRLTLAVFGPAQGASSAPLPGTAASEAAPDSAAVPPSDQDSESFLLADQSAGAVVSVPRREYLIGAVAAEIPISWPDEALKAQAIAAHSYALYCRDHAAEPASGWLSVDPVRRQGYLTDAVLRSYWGTAYEENYARLSALVDSVLTDVLYYDNAPRRDKLLCHLQRHDRGQRKRLGHCPSLSCGRGQLHRPQCGQLPLYRPIHHRTDAAGSRRAGASP